MKWNDKMNESDERYTTAEDAICDAFFLLLKEKDMDKITVSDIVKKSRNRPQHLLQPLRKHSGSSYVS